jgi:hypothetical protein
MARRGLKSNFVVSFRVNSKEMQNLRELAKESGLCLSTLVRERLNLEENHQSLQYDRRASQSTIKGLILQAMNL